MGGIKPSAMSAATVVAFKAKLGDDSIVYKHPLGDAEYVGNATYSSSGSVYGLACIQKIVTDCRIKYIRVRMWGTSTTAGILRVYKSTSLGSGSQQFSANTLIEEIPVTAGNFNVNATGFHSVTLTNELNLNTNEYLFVYFLQTKFCICKEIIYDYLFIEMVTFSLNHIPYCLCFIFIIF